MGHHFSLLSFDFILFLEINCTNNSFFQRKKERKKERKPVGFKCFLVPIIGNDTQEMFPAKKTLDNNVFPL